jgi:hypothetical protein
MRHQEEPLDFWIDALCINQDNNAEKGQQVQMMPDIYSKANMTCIWLGPAADDSDKAMDFINFPDKIDTTNANRLDTKHLVPTEALIALYSRTWWQRVWVIQEALLSQRSLVIRGTKTVPFPKFEALPKKERKMTETVRHAIRTGDLDSSFKRIWNFIPPTLPFYGLLELGPGLRSIRKSSPGPAKQEDAAALMSTLVRLAARFQATLPRDKVHGLLGLVPEAQAYLPPSYGPGKSDGEVFKDLSVYLIKWCNTLDAIFEWSRPGVEMADAPSWALDCTPEPKSSRWLMPYSYGTQYKADGGFRTWLRLTPMDVIKPYVLFQTTVGKLWLTLLGTNLKQLPAVSGFGSAV